MAKRTIPQAQQIAMWKKAVANPKTPPQLKAWMKKKLAAAG